MCDTYACTTWLKYHPQISYTHTCTHAHTGSPSSTTVATSVPTSTKEKSISTRKPPVPKKPTFNKEWRKKRQGQREFMGREAAAGACMNSNCVHSLAQSCAVD